MPSNQQPFSLNSGNVKIKKVGRIEELKQMLKGLLKKPENDLKEKRSNVEARAGAITI